MRQPLTAGQLLVIIAVCAALVGGFFLVRHVVRAGDAANREYNCVVTSDYPQLCTLGN